MKTNSSNRIISTPSEYIKEHYLYVQETGSLQSAEPHISRREHLHSLLFFVVKKGNGVLRFRGKKYQIETGDCVFLNCLEEYSHESSADHPWELSWVHFYGKEALDYYAHFISQGGSFIFHTNDLTLFLNPLQALFTELQNKNAFYEQKCHKYLTDIITLCSIESASNKNLQSESLYQKISEIRDYLDENYSKDISLDSLANMFFISKFHMSREFKQINGVTIMNYLNRKRISESKQLLRFTRLPIGQIAILAGIPDVNYFTKVFVKYESMTPSNFRKLWI